MSVSFTTCVSSDATSQCDAMLQLDLTILASSLSWRKRNKSNRTSSGASWNSLHRFRNLLVAVSRMICL